jgi:S1-C subfamily serine protease
LATVKTTFVSSLAAAVLGGGVTAGVLLGAGVVDNGGTRTIIQQSPLSMQGQPAASVSGDGALTAREIYKRDAPGVVFIRSQSLSTSKSPFDFFGPDTQRQEATGSGFVIDSDGHILTNAHVVNAATRVTVQFANDQTREAKIVGKDDSTDLALLKVDPDGLGLVPLELGDSQTVQVGDPTIAIGNPFGYDRTLTTGVVSALQRRITAPDNYTIENVIQTDAAINPGNSGGPLIDASGKVIGINSQIATGGTGSGSVGIGFAVPVNTAKKIVGDLKANGRVERPWLGVEFVPIDPSMSALNLKSKSGMLVQQVVVGGPAAHAGLKGGGQAIALNGHPLILGGDIITSLDGRPVKTSDDVRKALEARKPGDTVPMEILRSGAKKTLQVQLGNRPAGRPTE